MLRLEGPVAYSTARAGVKIEQKLKKKNKQDLLSSFSLELATLIWDDYTLQCSRMSREFSNKMDLYWWQNILSCSPHLLKKRPSWSLGLGHLKKFLPRIGVIITVRFGQKNGSNRFNKQSTNQSTWSPPHLDHSSVNVQASMAENNLVLVRKQRYINTSRLEQGLQVMSPVKMHGSKHWTRQLHERKRKEKIYYQREFSLPKYTQNRSIKKRRLGMRSTD